MKNEFTKTYLNNGWGSRESKSGIGSELEYTVNYREYLVKLIKREKIKTIFDSSCGDWNWMKEIKGELPNYIGNDIVEPLIENNIKRYGGGNIKFTCGDVLTQLKTFKDKELDLVISRHTLEHIPTDYVLETINEIKRVSKYAIITSSSGNNNEINSFDGRVSRVINLSKSPFIKLLGEPNDIFLDSRLENKGNYTTESIGCFGYLYKF